MLVEAEAPYESVTSAVRTVVPADRATDTVGEVVAPPSAKLFAVAFCLYPKLYVSGISSSIHPLAVMPNLSVIAEPVVGETLHLPDVGGMLIVMSNSARPAAP